MGEAKKKKPGTEKVLVGTQLMTVRCMCSCPIPCPVVLMFWSFLLPSVRSLLQEPLSLQQPPERLVRGILGGEFRMQAWDAWKEARKS